MKSKILAVLTSTAIGVMSLMPVITAQAYAVSVPCFQCGELSICDEVIDHKYVQITKDDEPEPCRHGHKLSADFLYEIKDLVRHYCSDCDVHWETWEHGYWAWYCTFDTKYH